MGSCPHCKWVCGGQLWASHQPGSNPLINTQCPWASVQPRPSVHQSIDQSTHPPSLPSVPTGSSLGIASCRPQTRQRGGEGVTHRGRRDGGLQPDEDKVDLRERFRLEREDWRRGGRLDHREEEILTIWLLGLISNQNSFLRKRADQCEEQKGQKNEDLLCLHHVLPPACRNDAAQGFTLQSLIEFTRATHGSRSIFYRY